MKTTSLQRSITLLSVMALLLTVFAVPASAATAPESTARIVSAKDVLARSQAVPFTIEIDYPKADLVESLQHGEKEPVNVIRIVPPTGLLTDLQGTTTGWDAFRNDKGHLFLVATDGAELEPGSEQRFSFTADIAAPSHDISRAIKVFLSDDDGATYTQSDEKVAGDLVTTVRVLNVRSVELTDPIGVTDYTASTDQSGITARLTVENRGAPAGTERTGIIVEPSLTGAEAVPTPAKTIAYDAFETFDFVVTMPSDPGSIFLTGGAKGQDATATAVTKDSPEIQVLRRVTLGYVPGTLAPTAVIGAAVPNAPAYEFKVGLTNTGQVNATLDATAVTFSLSTFTASLASAVPAGISPDTTELALSFESQQVALDDDVYTPTIQIAGTDENGARIAATIAIDEDVKVDTDVPVVNPVLVGTPSHLNAPEAGKEHVATDGAALTVGGTVTDTSGAACGDCTVTSAELVQLDGGLTPVGNAIDIDVTVDGEGKLNGSATPDYDDAAEFVRLRLSVKDAAGLVAPPATSNDIVVDNVAPTLALAKTGPAPATVTAERPDDRRTITVFESESVKFDPDTSPTDWKVDGKTVVGATAYRDTGSVEPGHADFVVLEVDSDLPADQTPRVTYEPALDGNRARDQVKKPLADQAVAALDGIVPDAARLVEVNGRISQDGSFFTNSTSPTITFDNIVLGHTVRLYELNDNGTTTLIEQKTQQQDSGRLTMNKDGAHSFSVPTTGGVRSIRVEVIDTGDNGSGLIDFPIVFDFIAPSLQQIVQDDRTLTVTLSESLSRDPDYQGRDSASDWSASYGTGQFAESFAATGVSSDGVRTITVTMEASAGEVDLDTASYAFMTGVGGGIRYEDRAGNPLQDATVAVTRLTP